MAYYIQTALEELEREVRRDNYNLSQEDHDAIRMKIQELKNFIEDRYGRHKQVQL